MSIPITDKFKPKGTGGYALMDAADVEMPDGTRLSDFKGGVTSVNGQTGDVKIEIPEAIDGNDGLTPFIGANGNWWIGNADTGVAATGAKGEKGDKGDKGDTGATGETGAAGKDGATGANGKDGVSPTVSISKTGKVTTITITDATGTHTANISDGEDGEDGQGASITLDTTLSEPGQAADAGAVGETIQQAMQVLDQLAGSIPTETTVYAWIDDYLSEALGGDY